MKAHYERLRLAEDDALLVQTVDEIKKQMKFNSTSHHSRYNKNKEAVKNLFNNE
jgi:hypothetical protein